MQRLARLWVANVSRCSLAVSLLQLNFKSHERQIDMIERQLKAIKKVAKKFYDKDPEHFGALITEIDAQLDAMREDTLIYIETLEEFDTCDFDLREIA